MTSSSNPNDRGTGDHHVDPDHAATDPRAAAQQDQVKADHDALQDQARRVNASVPASVRDTPVEPANRDAQATDNTRNIDEARENADAARDSARRVEQSVPKGPDRR